MVAAEDLIAPVKWRLIYFLIYRNVPVRGHVAGIQGKCILID
jgi:hypothetical protein